MPPLGIMPAVRHLLIGFLLCCFGLLTGLAQAHATVDELHQMHHQLAHDDTSPQDAGQPHSHDEGAFGQCETAHCVPLWGPLAPSALISAQTAAGMRPSSPDRPMRQAPPHPIERPQWCQATTPVAHLRGA